MSQSMRVWVLPGIPEVGEGADIAALILASSQRDERGLEDGDILVVTSKIVSKAEGRAHPASDRAGAVEAETARIVARRTSASGHETLIVENRLGIIGAAAGIDGSNVARGSVLLLPEDPDRSARELVLAIRERLGLSIGVVISDTLGRPWRLGQTDIAIGAAGVRLWRDVIGRTDPAGHALTVTLPCVADELAAAGDLVKGKLDRTPVAVVRGMSDFVGPVSLPGARSIVRPPAEDLFSLGTEEAFRAGYRAALEDHDRNAAAGVQGDLGVDIEHP